MTSINSSKLSPASNETCPPNHVVDPVHLIGTYALSFLFFMGIVGNVFNLLVLNMPRNRSKANMFLSAMAISDMGFFLFSSPQNVTAILGVYFDRVMFMQFVARTKMIWLTLVNSFSTGSIW